jgi:CBS domain-containing protein
MWWPALGAVVVGVVGYIAPDTLGVGYQNISNILSDSLTAKDILVLGLFKFISWSIALGSGTSGGTLAPLLTIGAGIGYLLGEAAAWLAPGMAVDVRVAALVGMAAMFAGASRAWLASVVFAFEVTLQPMSLLPLLGGCAMAYFISCLVMRHTIMTEKIARRGIRAPAEYTADPLDQVYVSEVASTKVIALEADDPVAEVRQWLESDDPDAVHQGFPVLNEKSVLLGVLTRRDLLGADATEDRTIADLIRRPPKFVYSNCTVRQAVDHMVNHGVGRLPVMSTEKPPRLLGILSRGDVLSCYRRNLDEHQPEPPTIAFPKLRRKRAVAT